MNFFKKLLNRILGWFKKKNVKAEVEPFVSYAAPLCRRTFPELFANNIVSVQPMSAPSGLIFAMRYLYGEDDGLFSFEDYGDDYDLYTWEDYDIE